VTSEIPLHRSATAPPRSTSLLATLVALLTGAFVGCADLERFGLDGIFPMAGPLTEDTVADGLKQALTVGTERAATSLSVEGGFAANPQIRLGLPGSLDDVATTLRRFGLGGQLDAFVDTMNLAAERAAGEAVPVFADAIRAMTLADAFAILNGPDDAATDYFRQHTSGALRARFSPVVDRSMESVGLYAQYRDLMARYDALPFVKPQVPDLVGYVTDRTLDGLFDVLAREEKAIREDPAARTTALLRRVFGASSSASTP